MEEQSPSGDVSSASACTVLFAKMLRTRTCIHSRDLYNTPSPYAQKQDCRPRSCEPRDVALPLEYVAVLDVLPYE